MKKFYKTLIQFAIAAVVLGGFAETAFAASLISASFSPNPLFSDSNFLPGNEREASITVNNNSESLQTAYIEAVNVYDSGLASKMNLEISKDSVQIYSGNFGSFLAAGPVYLSQIAAGSSSKYDLKINFISGTENNYQGKNLSFDICVGFSGGNESCTNETAFSSENGSGGGSGGGSSGSHHLIITDEKVLNIEIGGAIPETGKATITWTTNLPATSQVVYGLSSGSPYTLDLNSANFGYPSSTAEDMSKTIDHVVILTNLIPGETYVYRVVSKASPPTVSHEHEFLVPGKNESEGGIAMGGMADGGTVGGNQQENESNIQASSSSTSAGKIIGNNLAAAFFSGIGEFFGWWGLLWLILLLILAYLIKKLLSRKKENLS